MDEIKLKPCPFCGGKGVEILEAENKYLYYRYMAQCQKCGANAKLGRTKEEARKAWNRRAEAVHGRKIEDGDIGGFWLCSLCGEWLPYGANYCPSCGARMDGESE